MSAAEVVAASLVALDRNEAIVVPGWKYKALVAARR